MKKELIEFFADDGVILNGYINKNDKISNSILIEIHGMTSNCLKKRETLIAEEVKKIGIDTLCFNTRGSEIIKYIKYKDGRKKIAGTAYEDIEESYYDIIGAIKFVIDLGYESIYLQGHSLGATKIIYTYDKMQNENNKLLEKIKGIILLSLVDLPQIFKKYSNIKYKKYAEEKEVKNKLFELMPVEAFIHPISVKTFLQYTKYNKNIDFAQYDNKKYEFQILNNIKVPLFIRYGENDELFDKEVKKILDILNSKIKNHRQDINLICEANHTFTNKESELAREIRIFLENIQN